MIQREIAKYTQNCTRNRRKKFSVSFAFLFSVCLAIGLLLFSFSAQAANQLGASLYIAPLPENPKASSNFTATIKVDSLGEPVNAIKGLLTFNKDKLEIINISKIGSILNLWIDEPRFSNLDGTLKFQGGVPNPGFMGNGGVVLHIIFRAKGAGMTSLIWKEGEILASDGKGTNILTNLQNLDFLVEEAPMASNFLPKSNVESEGGGWSSLPLYTKILIYMNIVLFILVLSIGAYLLSKIIIRIHDRHFHQGEHDEEHESPHYTKHTEYTEHKEQGSDPKNDEFIRKAVEAETRRQEELKNGPNKYV